MLKHRGFPGRLTGTDHQFTIRRGNPKGGTRIVRRERYRDRRPLERAADEAFLGALIDAFGDAPFERGNLDAGRLSWLFGREVVAVDDPFDTTSYDARMRVDMRQVAISFPRLLSDEVESDAEGDEA
jgi:hypothetical protein